MRSIALHTDFSSVLDILGFPGTREDAFVLELILPDPELHVS
jgi:hypothetical protein